MYSPKEKKGKYTSINRRLMPQPYLAFSSVYRFHIHWFDIHIIVIHTKIGVVKGVVYICPTTQPPLLQL